ncbi:hypothetical protein PV08_00331 [Exophiala spinifera]|uniref:gamma-glutamylcyclotransferase n=1 Tax=Exophiala spinifera TaxID=91928 RepID=A0A0D2A4J3_9EURO|nr:uncharacterized protein PV08_00331 [Exophiala spinifera]KIW19757.1 hypothetical protein PV08_00331 [Exophiala spinifera]
MATQSTTNPAVANGVSSSPTTSSRTGTFYFAYGSNLSPVQMSLRLQHSPSSSVPVAIARLDNHAWIICKRGYANVVALPEGGSQNVQQLPSAQEASLATAAVSPHNEDPSTSSSEPPEDSESVVWGVLYNMHPTDEARLDLYEGHNEARNPTPVPNTDKDTVHIKSHLQGGWDYNKHYLPVTVTKWLRGPKEYGVGQDSGSDSDFSPVEESSSSPSSPSPSVVRALVYVDEFRTEPGKIVHEYIGRMNRAIQESVGLGIPAAWVDKVMRKFIPEGIYVEDHAYVGTDEGYVEGEGDEEDLQRREERRQGQEQQQRRRRQE